LAQARSFGEGTPSHLIGAMPADGAALLAAAVRAAVLAKAPRRTVQAVASAVTGVLARPETAQAAKGPVPTVPAGSQSAAAESAGEQTPEVLLQTLRAARSAQRRRKKERRKARKEATRNAAPSTEAEGRELEPLPGGTMELVPTDAKRTGITDLSSSHAGAPPAKKLKGGGRVDGDLEDADDARSDLTDWSNMSDGGYNRWQRRWMKRQDALPDSSHAQTLSSQRSVPTPRQDRQRKGRSGASA